MIEKYQDKKNRKKINEELKSTIDKLLNIGKRRKKINYQTTNQPNTANDDPNNGSNDLARNILHDAVPQGVSNY